MSLGAPCGCGGILPTPAPKSRPISLTLPKRSGARPPPSSPGFFGAAIGGALAFALAVCCAWNHSPTAPWIASAEEPFGTSIRILYCLPSISAVMSWTGIESTSLWAHGLDADDFNLRRGCGRTTGSRSSRCLRSWRQHPGSHGRCSSAALFLVECRVAILDRGFHLAQFVIHQLRTVFPNVGSVLLGFLKNLLGPGRTAFQNARSSQDSSHRKIG